MTTGFCLNIIRCAATVWYVLVYALRLLGLRMHVRRTAICHCDNTEPHDPTRKSYMDTSVPGVSILRPMKSEDSTDLYECLKSTFVQNYPEYEILMCVTDPKDSAVAVAERLISEFPHVRASLLVGPDHYYGINPKVNNLVKGYKVAKFDIIWCLDSNVKMHPNALSRAVREFKGNIQLVHHLPVAISKPDACWGAALDEAYMLSAHSTFYSGINAVGIAPCVTGKSNLYRRSDLDKAAKSPEGCGLEHFARYMAEDQMISETLWRNGGRTAIAPDAAVQLLANDITLHDFWSRRARWIRLRKYMVTKATLVEPFTDSIFGIFFFTWVLQLNAIWFWVLLVISFIVDSINYRVLLTYTDKTAVNTATWIFSWISREILALPLWLWAMSGRRILWRNQYYTIRRDLVAETAN